MEASSGMDSVASALAGAWVSAVGGRGLRVWGSGVRVLGLRVSGVRVYRNCLGFGS